MAVTYPFNDSDMTYDLSNHRYALSKGYLLKNGQNLDEILDATGDSNKSTLPKRLLERASMLVYNHIYSFNHNMFGPEYHLAKNAQLRTMIRDVLLEQVLFMLSNGDLSLEAGVDLIRLKALNTSKIMSAGISAQVEEMLLNSGIINSIYQSRRLFSPDYTTDAY